MTQEPVIFGKSIDGHPTCAIDTIFSVFLTQIYHVASKDFEYNTHKSNPGYVTAVKFLQNNMMLSIAYILHFQIERLNGSKSIFNFNQNRWKKI